LLCLHSSSYRSSEFFFESPSQFNFMNVSEGTNLTYINTNNKVFLAVLPCVWRVLADVSKAPPAHQYGIPSETCVKQYRCEYLQSSLSSQSSAPHTLCKSTPSHPLNTLIPNFRCVTRFFSHCDKHFSNHSLPICVNYAGTLCPTVPVCIIACLAFAPIVSTVFTHNTQVSPPHFPEPHCTTGQSVGGKNSLFGHFAVCVFARTWHFVVCTVARIWHFVVCPVARTWH